MRGAPEGHLDALAALLASPARSGAYITRAELINLALDVGLATQAFPMVRVQNIFERADQNDDKRKAADNGLAYHEFLEAVVMLAFHRANPKFGQVGFERAAEAPAGTGTVC